MLFLTREMPWTSLLVVLAILHSHKGVAHTPLALHHLYEVAADDEVVISLRGHDLDGDATTATITRLPRAGALFQLSHVFDTHGYDPKAGAPIAAVPAVVAGGDARVVYRRRRHDPPGTAGRDADDFEYTVRDRGEEERAAGRVTLVSDRTRLLVSSDFRFDDEGWTTTGNAVAGVRHEASRRGEMNHYVFAVDDVIDLDADKNDRRAWKFVLPDKYRGWSGVWYGGTFEFTLSSFSGDFSGVNDHGTNDERRPLNLVEIYCASCDLFKGATIAFPLSEARKFDGRTTEYSLVMTEAAGWTKDPQNVLFEWMAPSRCSFIEVLSGISSVRILGDFTNWCVRLGSWTLVRSLLI